MRSAIILLLPCAILPNGPAWTRTGVPYKVCINVGSIASFMSTVIAPAQPMSYAVIASPWRLRATSISPNRRRMSSRSLDRAKIAITYEATEMSKPVRRVMPFSALPWPMVISRNMRSFTSVTRFHEMVSWSMSRRANRVRYYAVKSFGLVLSMPNLAKRVRMMWVKSCN